MVVNAAVLTVVSIPLLLLVLLLLLSLFCHRTVDGVLIGVGNCVVDESGVPLPLTKLKIAELRVEATVRGCQEVEDMKRAELMTFVKVGSWAGGGGGAQGGG